MQHKILALRKALVHYEECVDVDAAEHITGKSLIDLQNAAYAVANEANLAITTFDSFVKATP